MWNQGSPDKSERGATVTRQGCVSPPFSLIQNKTDDPGASFTLLRRSALQPLPQCTASVLAVHCILHANTCNLSCTYLQSSLQVLATFPVSICGPRKALPLSPQAFASSGIRDTPHLISFIPYPRADMPPFSVRMTAKSFSYVSESSFGHGLFCRMLLFYLSYIMQDL